MADHQQLFDQNRKAYGQIMAKAWKDDAFAARFKSDPKGVLKEHGIEVPEGVTVHVHESDESTIHLPIPQKPGGQVNDEHLAAVAGGSSVSTSGSASTAGCPTSSAGSAGTYGCAG